MKYFRLFFLCVLIFFLNPTFALRLPLPLSCNDLVGQIQFASVREGETFATIAERYDVGYYQLVEANPEVDPNQLQPGSVLIIPTQYLLPPAPKEGIIINLAAMRLYYFPKGKNYFYTYPVGIGRFNWSTPLGKLHIIQKIKNPVWVVPDSILHYRQENGDPVPKVMPSGPENPLGYYALRLSQPTYLIHSTNDPSSVGRRSSAGCIHLYPGDMKALFGMIFVDTPVLIINQPYVVGQNDGKLYLEAHLPLKEDRKELFANLSRIVETLINEHLKSVPEEPRINLQKATEIVKEHIGLPALVSLSKASSNTPQQS
ncbi:L,D-transpeptidase family protein [Coxiella endosymbiont of Ornithodoros maritimus]|uniref:L,D-transpeptidase family protein n=1 Tax=Coxiella endosymbiont of Ornithodoros maritimus TaxID=1656172 RepID=UPI002264EF86|nr:L,D-transpeptidase family protein [Coxiella endosymbiont of Ornithodoros maritimus]